MKKSDLIIPTLQPNLEVGCKVVFVDGSYTTAIIKGKFREKTLLGLSEEIWTIIAINVSCPSDIRNENLIQANNCICINDDGDIAFCSGLNIRSIRALASKVEYTLKELQNN